jgi:hypothetical protein
MSLPQARLDGAGARRFGAPLCLPGSEQRVTGIAAAHAAIFSHAAR